MHRSHITGCLFVAAAVALASCAKQKQAEPSPPGDAALPADASPRPDARVPVNLGKAERVQELFQRDCPRDLPPEDIHSKAKPVPRMYLGQASRWCVVKAPGVGGQRYLSIQSMNDQGYGDPETRDYDYWGGYVSRVWIEYSWRTNTPRPAACDRLPEEALEYFEALSGIGADFHARLAATIRSVDSTVLGTAYHVRSLDIPLYVRTLHGRDPTAAEPRCAVLLESGHNLPVGIPRAEVDLATTVSASGPLDGGTNDAR